MKYLFVKVEIEMFPEPLIGTVEERITSNQSGRVKFLGTYWPAKLHESDREITLIPEETIHIIGIQGITLLVVPINNELTHQK
ncbi:NfeD family protein [Floridanema aerugineum]|jgi:membrane protein implicated in regulation of membrane protease activity|uniref:NfeD family protein n=1 Tax=Floridaenema aerugineum BLCC-F46 TaxID=3153654 RepID=A0ABV4X2P5_9CYAN